jgi:hypothetical protein
MSPRCYTNHLFGRVLNIQCAVTFVEMVGYKLIKGSCA